MEDTARFSRSQMVTTGAGRNSRWWSSCGDSNFSTERTSTRPQVASTEKKGTCQDTRSPVQSGSCWLPDTNNSVLGYNFRDATVFDSVARGCGRARSCHVCDCGARFIPEGDRLRQRLCRCLKSVHGGAVEGDVPAGS